MSEKTYAPAKAPPPSSTPAQARSPLLQRQARDLASPAPTLAPPIVHDVLASSGQPLTPPTHSSRSLPAELPINQPGDACEQVADHISDQVMRASDSNSVGNVTSPASVERSATGLTAPPIVRQVIETPGQPLSAGARGALEPRFGHDFSHVSIHADAQAAESASSVHAHAYTVGNHIVFGAGRYAPETSAGRRLLTHELTHVVQQSTGPTALLRQAEPEEAPKTLPEALERIRNIPIIFTTEYSAEVISSALQNIDLSNPSKLDAVVATINQKFKSGAGPILTMVLAKADARLPRRSLPAAHEPTPDERARMDAQIRALQVPRRGPYGLVGPGILALAAIASVQAVAHALMNSFRGAGAFVEGLVEGFSQSMSADQVRQLTVRLLESAILNVAFPLVFAAGAAVGIAEDVIDAVKSAYHLITNLPETLRGFVELLSALMSDQAQKLGHDAGVEIGKHYASKVTPLLQNNIIVFTYQLGRMIGPTIVYTVLAVLGVPEMLAEQLAARLMPILEQFLERFPGLLRVVEKLAGPLRRAGKVTSGAELDAELERMIAATMTEPAPIPRGGAPTPHAPELAFGFQAQELSAFKRLLGTRMTDQDVAVLGRIWRAVANPGEEATLTLQNSRRLFDNQRNRFWRQVRKDASARKLFEDAGCVFEGGAETAPFHRMPDGSKFQMTIDHMDERQMAPTRALDPTNLQIVSRRENTVSLRQLHDQDVFQRH
jgi:hypothetical protein